MLLLSDVIEWRWACYRATLRDLEPAKAFARRFGVLSGELDEALRRSAPGAGRALLEVGEAVLSAGCLPPPVEEAVRRVWLATFGGDLYNPEDDDPVCDCAACAGHVAADPGCLFAGMSASARAFLGPFLVWAAENPAHHSSPAYMAQMAFWRSDARTLGSAARALSDKQETRDREISNAITEAAGLGWSC